MVMLNSSIEKIKMISYWVYDKEDILIYVQWDEDLVLVLVEMNRTQSNIS